MRQGIANYQKLQQWLGELLEEEESRVLAGERAVVGEGKKNYRRRLRKR